MLDAVLRGGTVIDGSGGRAVQADVGISAGRIVDVGQKLGPARETYDVGGLVVAPGVIDPHVHYDAQVLWDPALTPSSLHGVTTVVGGNCGFSLAPVAPGHELYLARLLARVEGMPLQTLLDGVDWSWESWADYANRLEGSLVVNAAFFAGHSTIRRVVMGRDATKRAATDDERAAIVAIAAAALDQGAVGISTSMSESHHDGDGLPVPSRFADRAELIELASLLGTRAHAIFELTPALRDGFGPQEKAFLAEVAAAAGTVLWNALLVDGENPDYHENLLSMSELAAARNARIIALTLPDLARVRLSVLNAAFWEAVPGWADLFSLDEPARLEALREPDRLQRMQAGLDGLPEGPLRRFTDIATLTVGEVSNPRNAACLGRRIGAIAQSDGRTPFEVFIDLVLSEQGKVGFWAEPIGDDDHTWRLRRDVWRRDDVLVGGGDAGAHLDVIDSFAYPTALLGPVVRDRGLLELTEAVAMLTARPAEVFGFADRGRIEAGMRADLMVFDPQTVGPGRLELREDLPSGGRRLFSAASGVHQVWVNGTRTLVDGEVTGARPGQLLRRG